MLAVTNTGLGNSCRV